MIPKTAHFIWFGTELPWVHLLAMRSAALRGCFDKVVLHHADDLSGAHYWGELQDVPGFESRPLDAEALVADVDALGPRLVSIYRKLTQPAGRANMVRAALLYGEGGVYLDLDTVTVACLTPLREEAQVFCGVERIVFPETVKRSKDPRVKARAYAQTALRDVCRRLPYGYRAFRRVEDHYPQAANNAVLGAGAGHPFVGDMLERMVALPPERHTVRFALGTHLLQAAVAGWRGEGLRVYAPEVFYPLGPEISEHWFRRTLFPRLDEVLTPETRVVHWYASVRTKKIVPRIDPGYVRENAKFQLFSKLALPFV